jgi:vitamin B12 transporter
LSELYGFNPLMRGNERLLAEEAKSAEVGVRYAGGSAASVRGWVDGALFARGSENLILFVRSAQGYLTPQNRDSARTLGAELAAGIELGEVGSLVVQVSYVDARDTSPGRTLKNDILPFISAVTTSALAHVAILHDPEGPLLLNLGVRASYQSERFADPAGLGVIPAQSNVDLEADAHLFQDALIARASVRNIFDTSRYDVVGYPLPGRSAFLSLETRFK